MELVDGDLPDGRQPEHGHCLMQEPTPRHERGRRGGFAEFADGDAADSRFRDDAVTVQRLDASPAWYGGDRTKQEILKNVFDQFNNQDAFGSF
jgi:hypothetical protein